MFSDFDSFGLNFGFNSFGFGNEFGDFCLDGLNSFDSFGGFGFDNSLGFGGCGGFDGLW